MNRQEIIDIASTIRQFICEEFPESQDLKNQCKRAAILFDIYSKRRRWDSYPTAGFITKENDFNEHSRGHVWNVVNYEGERYVLDITLTQFQDYLETNIPEVIFIPYKEAKEIYKYKPDGYGEYEYEKEDVRRNLVEKVENL